MYHQKFLSVQSCVSYGHVGNSAVTFPLQRLGAHVYPIHTVMFSNHTGYGKWKGAVLEPDVVENVFQGMMELGVLHNCDALLTGYMGSKELGKVMQTVYKELKLLNPDLVYCCDPVIGDIGRGIFVREGIPEFFKQQMLQHATIVTPNHFELEYLSEMSFKDVPGAIKAARKLLSHGPSIVVVTSLRLAEAPDQIHVLVVDNQEVFLVTTPLLPVTLNGTGDLTSALFTYFYLREKKISKALEQAIARVYCVIAKTLEAGSKELLLIQAQEELNNPSSFFQAIPYS